ncbi:MULTISPECIES: hypothetical protein, partial [Streptomyces]|uniref:hypothetical protein n=1 Tax=Streptomyces TaxID=1883 RepID=UPI001F20C92F
LPARLPNGTDFGMPEFRTTDSIMSRAGKAAKVVITPEGANKPPPTGNRIQIRTDQLPSPEARNGKRI